MEHSMARKIPKGPGSAAAATFRLLETAWRFYRSALLLCIPTLASPTRRGDRGSPQSCRDPDPSPDDAGQRRWRSNGNGHRRRWNKPVCSAKRVPPSGNRGWRRRGRGPCICSILQGRHCVCAVRKSKARRETPPGVAKGRSREVPPGMGRSTLGCLYSRRTQSIWSTPPNASPRSQ